MQPPATDQVLTHRINFCNICLTIKRLFVNDDPPNQYEISLRKEPLVHLSFQNGDPAVSINGITNEALLAVVMDRLQRFQAGEFKCRENALALTKLEEAMHWLAHRTNERIQRGVEGTSLP